MNLYGPLERPKNLSYSLTYYLTYQGLTDRLTYSLSDWLTDWLTDWRKWRFPVQSILHTQKYLSRWISSEPVIIVIRWWRLIQSSSTTRNREVKRSSLVVERSGRWEVAEWGTSITSYTAKPTRFHELKEQPTKKYKSLTWIGKKTTESSNTYTHVYIHTYIQTQIHTNTHT